MINFANFNPRSREGSDIFLAEFHQLLCHFNPRSREGSDARSAQETQYRSCISIHAPARGATCYIEAVRRYLESISIHAPARGATYYTRLEYHRFAISIHAPARGATPAVSRSCAYMSNFNPRSREGSDDAAKAAHGKQWVFQSTLPRGERQSSAC